MSHGTACSRGGALALALLVLSATPASLPRAAAAPPALPPCEAAYIDNPLGQNWEVRQPDGEILYLSTSEGRDLSGPCRSSTPFSEEESSKEPGCWKNVVVKGGGAAIMRTGRAAGVLDNGSDVVKAPTSAIELADDAVPVGVPNGTVAEIEAAGSDLDDVEGRRSSQSSDLGGVYELPNLGGVPEVTLDAKAGILKGARAGVPGEDRAAAGARRGAEALQRAQEARGPGQDRAQRREDREACDARCRLPKDILGEASVWTGPADASRVRRPPEDAAAGRLEGVGEGEEELGRVPRPSSRFEGGAVAAVHRPRGPRPARPRADESGLQRFVRAEFEEVLVSQGEAQAKLIRVKKCRVEVVERTVGRYSSRSAAPSASS